MTQNTYPLPSNSLSRAFVPRFVEGLLPKAGKTGARWCWRQKQAALGSWHEILVEANRGCAGVSRAHLSQQGSLFVTLGAHHLFNEKPIQIHPIIRP